MRPLRGAPTDRAPEERFRLLPWTWPLRGEEAWDGATQAPLNEYHGARGLGGPALSRPWQPWRPFPEITVFHRENTVFGPWMFVIHPGVLVSVMGLILEGRMAAR